MTEALGDCAFRPDLGQNASSYTTLGQIAHFPGILCQASRATPTTQPLKRTFRGLITPEYHLLAKTYQDMLTAFNIRYIRTAKPRATGAPTFRLAYCRFVVDITWKTICWQLPGISLSSLSSRYLAIPNCLELQRAISLLVSGFECRTSIPP